MTKGKQLTTAQGGPIQLGKKGSPPLKQEKEPRKAGPAPPPCSSGVQAGRTGCPARSSAASPPP
eukprot:2097360-Rhodomonas_salina.1